MARVKRTLFFLVGPALGAAIAGLLLIARQPTVSEPLFGFTPAGSVAERQTERRFLALPEADRIQQAHRLLTEKPHVAGSPRDRELAEWTRDRWREYGLEQVAIVEHAVLLPYPEHVSIEMTAPREWRASMREDPIPGDPDTAADDLPIHHHAYSASGEVEAEVVYAGSGNPEDYDWLVAHGIDVRGKIALVRYSVPYSYRGFKALTAQQRGAAAILIYSDPMDDGAGRGAVYPDGPWGNDSHMQSGSIAYDFLAPGDPLTPGWASVPAAPRLQASEALSLPTIISAPLSARDARPILAALGGPRAPEHWQGALGFTYHVGPGAATVRMRVRMDDAVRPIWTVIGNLRGAERPEEVIVVGNHRDAWLYGGVDPSSGSAAMMELARTLGTLAREGRRPRRTIVFASWDAEEFTMTSSTEWGEQNAEWLRDRALAYLNVDSAVSGPDLDLLAVPSLNTLVVEAARAVPDPATGRPLVARWRWRVAADRGVEPDDRDLVENRLGSGSDYTVFLNFVGLPVADLSFDGPHGVYHSVYDNHQWVSRIGDPGFRYHVALVQLWGVMALRLANADLIPLDPRDYARRVHEYLDELDERWLNVRRMSGEAGATDRSPELAGARKAAERFAAAAAQVMADGARALREADTRALDALNRRLRTVESALIDEAGLPGRPWYRHQIYAPKYTYAPELLPGVAAAVDVGDATAVRREGGRLATALDRAAATLSPLSP
jgi:N-acetylated-alpha-linked acidic dipeptidase